MPLVFSYGSLQEESVQLSIYGRVLRSEPDALVGWVRTLIEVPKWHKAAARGMSHYANAERSPDAGHRVEGAVLELSEAELAATDVYESEAGYRRLMTAVASGRNVWLYVSAVVTSR